MNIMVLYSYGTYIYSRTTPIIIVRDGTLGQLASPGTVHVGHNSVERDSTT